MRLRVLVACEMSGRVRDAFAARGWEAWSADLFASERPAKYTYRADGSKFIEHPNVLPEKPGYHYEGDVLPLLNWNHPINQARSEENRHACIGMPAPPLWDLIIAHPPCDHLSYAGARWFKEKQADGRQEAGLEFFGKMLNAPSPLVAVENPHSIAQERYGKATQIVQPWWFGDPFIKGIHLWLKGLQPLTQQYTEEYYPGLFRVTTGGGSWRTDKTQMRERMSAYEDSEGRKNRAKVRSRTMPGLARAFADQWGCYTERYYQHG